MLCCSRWNIGLSAMSCLAGMWRMMLSAVGVLAGSSELGRSVHACVDR